MLQSILFIDTVCPKPYDPTTLKTEALGGTEATVVRIAEALGKKYQNAVIKVAQHNRPDGNAAVNSSVVYVALKPHHLVERQTAIVVLRNPQVALNLRKYHPDTPIFLWLHDLVTNDMIKYAAALGEQRIAVVTVSNFHRTNFVTAVQVDKSIKTWPRILTLFNPIDDALVPDDTLVNPNKLCFVSSPHKGLDQTLHLFNNLRRVRPKIELHITNPGYLEIEKPELPGVVYHGPMPHAESIKHVRESVCLFSANHVYPETFGLALAEANAVGTPVLTHPFGAAPEVLNGNFQLEDMRSTSRSLVKLLKWLDGGRPKVTCKPEFRTSEVIKLWGPILGLRGMA